MAHKPLLRFATWTAAVTCAGAATIALPSEITNLVPSCALDCLQSFVSNNYGAAGCGTSPSFPCLCQNTGSSGFTIGEGAVQCLVAEISRKACDGGDASQEGISKAYTMCATVRNAAPATHPTIVATLVIPSGTGPVQVPGASQTVNSSQTSATISTSQTVSITPALTTSSTTSPGSVTTSAAAAPTLPADSGRRGPPLKTAQIAGISVGIAATLGFAIGLIFLARCVRKRNFGDQESILFKPKRESKGFGTLKSNQNSPKTLQISAPIHKTPIDMEFRRPGDFQRQAPETIGLALSPPRDMRAAASDRAAHSEGPVTVKQPPKAYIPYTPVGGTLSKPALTLTIPQDAGQPQKEARVLQSSCDSVMTEFQEDGEGESVAGSNIWRPPPTDPQSTTTYYVADKWGNWVLSNKDSDSKLAELPCDINRTKAERANDDVPESPVDRTVPTTGQFPTSKPRSMPQTDAAPARLGPPIQFKDREQATPSSSIYSAYSLPRSVAPGAGNPLPLTGAPAVRVTQQDSGKAAKGLDASKRRTSRRGSRQGRRKSQDSATTIASSVAELDEQTSAIEGNLLDGLSPVVESPRTPVSAGRSPVTYPKLPGTGGGAPERRWEQANKQLPSPPKAQPALTLFPRPSRNDHLSPSPATKSGQTAPGLGAVNISPLRLKQNPPTGLIPGATRQQPLRGPALNPNPIRNPAEFKTGSPEMRSGSAPPEGERQRRPSSLHKHHPYQQHHHRRGSSLQLQQQQQRQQPYQPSTGPGRSLGEQDSSGFSSSQEQTSFSGLPDRILISPASATTSGSVDSTGSSFLLTKRLGADRAAALTLGDAVVGKQSARRVKWQREQGGSDFVGHDTAAALPSTPGWLPKLTPTRRGDDLFLNVQ
ncbi:hypothetical protein GE09DRAFT_1260286 [Coniochaeta sp. 2T2.1]|nr:hypothetical protein GE09DRAFT_1260286 [Coniochaeta sp. 2T2.1]